MLSWLRSPGGLAALFLLSFLLAVGGGFDFLWVFPLDAAGLPLWMLLVGLDLLLSLFPDWRNARLLLWCGGLLLFSARQGAPWIGLSLIALSAALWSCTRTGLRLFPVLAAGFVLLLVAGHESRLVHPGMSPRLQDWRFAGELLAGFAFFRILSWFVAVRARGARPGFLDTMEYFLAPAFWLSPLHAAHLIFERMDKRQENPDRERALGWMLRGLLHAAVFSLFVSALVPRLEARFRSGLSGFLWWEWLLLGPLLFVLSYLEKSRVSYLVAGVLSFTGREVEPDFRSPWLARDLLEYWRRFHFWMWEYYVELVYLPLSTLLVRRLPPRGAALLGLFLSFSVGTSLIHWVHYPAPLATAFLLGLLFGLASLAHAVFSARLQRSRLGIPLTWLTVFLLYALAYPSYGLGWGWAEWRAFLAS